MSIWMNCRTDIINLIGPDVDDVNVTGNKWNYLEHSGAGLHLCHRWCELIPGSLWCSHKGRPRLFWSSVVSTYWPEHGACSICCGCNFHACRRLEHDTTIRPGIARAAGWLWLLHLWQTTKWKHNTTQSRRCSSSSFSSFHIFPVCVGQLFFVFFFAPATFIRLLCVCASLPATPPPSPATLPPSLCLFLLFFSHCDARTHAHTQTRPHTHTPVSNLYEMIPNAFESQWEFPL